ncbi:hypothetical protein [Algibacter pectinivorans]|uniref:MetA-pathway of phenol degradation n=1 Tax=Algibacter pectinivorans TaxID=870482 RepID=A0A1I1QCC0_9FLAO|nr:hypothetical protein [Algibacter pectinivorans]SFD19794.1 hypothetical protein SAMN04487987_10628 [Algibacter pectinivorans]
MKDSQNFNKISLFVIAFIMNIHAIKATEIDPPFDTYKHVFEPFGVTCDLCGCSTSSGSFGFGTLSNSNFVGIRYIYQSFESKDGIFSNSPTTKETFNTYQLWAQLPINDVFYLSLNVPYQDLNRAYENGYKENLNGLGDSSIMGWYKLQFYKKESDSLTFSTERMASGHSLQFGVGVKLPTGKFEEALADNVNPGFQVGTGSVDGVFAIGYNYGSNKFGVNTLMTYYLKGENKNDYQFGNQFSYSTNFFTAFSKKNYNIMPFIGFSGDVYDKITQYNETLADTDGKILSGTIGSEVAIEKFIFGTNYTLPLSQNLFGGNVKSKNRFSIYVNFAL